jgi:pimeloyl-ACP methyl ester carboxylesterase
MSFASLKDGTRIRYSDRGTGSRTFLLVHGWKQSHRLFDKITFNLSQESRVFSYDQRGMGESDKPNCTYDFDLLANDLSELIEKFSLANVYLVGWSMGCTTSLNYLQRADTDIRGLVLMNGPLTLEKKPDFDLALTTEVLDKYIADLELHWPRNEREFYAESLMTKNSYLVDMLNSVGQQTPLDVAVRLVKNQRKIDHRETVKSLRIPVLAIYSAHDPYWPNELGDWISNNAAIGQYVMLENSAHCAPLEEPETLCNVLKTFADDCESRNG